MRHPGTGMSASGRTTRHAWPSRAAAPRSAPEPVRQLVENFAVGGMEADDYHGTSSDRYARQRFGVENAWTAAVRAGSRHSPSHPFPVMSWADAPSRKRHVRFGPNYQASLAVASG